MGWVCMFKCDLVVNLCVLKKYFCLVFRKKYLLSYKNFENFSEVIHCKINLKNFNFKISIIL